jgi:RNA polymerase sigma factor (sigma-70 family)
MAANADPSKVGPRSRIDRGRLRTPLSRTALRFQSDSRLVELAREGVEPAFELIVRRYRSQLLRYCQRLLPADRAEDVVQQTFLNALVALRDGDNPRQLKSWLYRITHNLALNALRKNGWDYDPLPHDLDGVEQPHDVLDRRSRLSEVLERIGDLPERQRAALLSRELEGRSYEEIAAELGATTPVVRQLLSRARIRLRDGAGALLPLPLLRALTWGFQSPAASQHVGEAAAGAAAGGGVAKIGVSLLAAATVAAGAGVAVEQHGDARHPHRLQAGAPAAGDSGSAAGTSGSAGAAADRPSRATSHDSPAKDRAADSPSGDAGRGSEESGDGRPGRGPQQRSEGSAGEERQDGPGESQSPARDDSGHGDPAAPSSDGPSASHDDVLVAGETDGHSGPGGPSAESGATDPAEPDNSGPGSGSGSG